MKTNSVLFAKALADPTRQKIMELTCCQWMNVTDIVNAVGVSQPTVSHHLGVLKESGLVSVRTEGKHTYYTLNQGRVATCCGQILQVFAPESEEAEFVKAKETKYPG
jgi:DNA-binding transcriptional ArsR family regulator